MFLFIIIIVFTLCDFIWAQFVNLNFMHNGDLQNSSTIRKRWRPQSEHNFLLTIQQCNALHFTDVKITRSQSSDTTPDKEILSNESLKFKLTTHYRVNYWWSVYNNK